MIQKLHSFLETVNYSYSATFADLMDLSFAINLKVKENLNTNKKCTSNTEQNQENEMVRNSFKDIFINAKIADIEIPSSNNTTYPYCNECETDLRFKQKCEKGLKFNGEKH
ncbi:unnamed protein product [Rhizophagus irregularis]|nr:unnamed protein product [Rhizophagus irregularis]